MKLSEKDRLFLLAMVGAAAYVFAVVGFALVMLTKYPSLWPYLLGGFVVGLLLRGRRGD